MGWMRIVAAYLVSGYFLGLLKTFAEIHHACHLFSLHFILVAMVTTFWVSVVHMLDEVVRTICNVVCTALFAIDILLFVWIPGSYVMQYLGAKFYAYMNEKDWSYVIDYIVAVHEGNDFNLLDGTAAALLILALVYYFKPEWTLRRPQQWIAWILIGPILVRMMVYDIHHVTQDILKLKPFFWAS